jgi:hypothetical protein
MAIVKPPVVPAWAETASGSPDIVQPTDGFIQAGWPLTSIPPSRGFFNWVLHFAANGIRYLSKFGIVDWDAAETYSAGAIVRDTYTENSFTRRSYFQAIGTPTTTAPHLDTTNWAIILELPIAQSLNHAREIMSWRNSNGKRRFAVNHLGFPGGKLLRWSEDWSSTTDPLTATSSGTGTLKARWLTTVLGTGAGMSLTGPSAIVLSQSACMLQNISTGATVPQTDHIESTPILLNDGASSFSWACDAGTLAATLWDHNEVAIGVQGATSQSINDTWRNAGTATGLAFFAVPGTSTWQAYVKASGGSSSVFNTGVTVDGAIHRFAIHYQGVGDGGTATAAFFIDGVLVVSTTIAFTAATMLWSAFCHTTHVSSGTGGTFIQGVVDWNSALWGSSDVVL